MRCGARGRSAGARRAAPPGSRALAGLLLATCAPPAPAEARFDLVDFRQAGKDAVALNEELVFHFSRELDRTSVTRETVRIRDARGASVAGDFQVRGSVLIFRPLLPLRADLEDGGLRPGEDYTVELIGFPRPDGLRGKGEAVLSTSVQGRFRTAAADGPAPLFADPFLEQAGALQLRHRRLGPLDPIVLSYAEALDPRTLDGDDFALVSRQDAQRIPLRAELVLNRREGAVLRLRPLSTDVALGGLRALSAGDYVLFFDNEHRSRLRTLGGRPVLRLPAGPGGGGWSFHVVEPTPETWVETFETTDLRAREAIEGVDGTASWSGDGAVRVRYPRAAGDGRDGAVAAWPPGPALEDVRATRLRVPAGERWELAGEGLRVLRSQGALVVDGTLARAARAGTPPIADSLRGPDRRFLADAGTLSDWLERARAQGDDWTVLVAGGDLRIGGALEVDGPLLLVAGGWIRVLGRVEAPEIWKSLEGGENLVAPEGVRVAPFREEPPAANPLVEPLRFAVLSHPLRPSGGVLRWGGASVEGDAGDGRFRVRFLGLRDLAPGGAELFGPLDDPALLADCPAVRFLVELEVDPSEGPWDPPRVDSVSLQWSAPAPSDDRPSDG